jgi:plasmid stabilization system protein ParE
MKLKLSKDFLLGLKNQVEYIAKDKPSFARKFKAGVYKELRIAAEKPKLFRKSKYILRPNYRDVIYKGHTIIVKESNEFLEVIDIIYIQAFPEDEQ